MNQSSESTNKPASTGDTGTDRKDDETGTDPKSTKSRTAEEEQDGGGGKPIPERQQTGRPGPIIP